MYGNNDYRDYLMHADHKYLEKIVNGAKTRYFYTREQLQGYYNSLKNHTYGLAARAVAGAKSNARQIGRLANRQAKRIGRKVRTSDIATSWRKNEGVPGAIKKAGVRTRNTVTNLRGSVPGAIYRGKKAAKNNIINAWNNIVSGAKNAASTVRRKSQAARIKFKNRKDQNHFARTTYGRQTGQYKEDNENVIRMPGRYRHENHKPGSSDMRKRGVYASRNPR